MIDLHKSIKLEADIQGLKDVLYIAKEYKLTATVKPMEPYEQRGKTWEWDIALFVPDEIREIIYKEIKEIKSN